MTIKQQGGVFGRNPTFNDLTAETADFSSSALGSASATALTINSTTDRNVILRDNDAFSGADNQIKLAIAPSVVSGQSAGVAFGTFSNPQYWKQGIFWKRSSTFGIGDLSFAVRSTADTTTVTEADKKLTIARYGDVTVHSGNLVIGTSGKGIDFSATSGTGTSELFDDYEEGTWTPVVADASSGGNAASGTFYGHYTKVGNLVTVIGSLRDINTSGMTTGNPIYVQGLPYACSSLTGTIMFTGSVQATSLLFTGFVSGSVADGTSYLRFFDTSSGGGFSTVPLLAITSGTTDIYFTTTYQA